jgi:hypothetical protein
MLTPTDAVFTEVYRLLRYLNHTKELGLVVGGNEIDLFGMVDSSFVYSGDSKSQMGFAIYLGRNSGCVSSYSKRATTVALSTTHAETDSLTECVKEIKWFQGFIQSIRQKVEDTIRIYVDNFPVVILTKDGDQLKRSKYNILKLNWIKEQQENGLIKIEYIKTIDNHSDIFTKALKGESLRYHTMGILGNGYNNNYL